MKFWKFIPVVVLTILTSCEDSLTIDDVENRTVVRGYYNSAERIEQAVIGSYVNLRRALLANHAWMMYGEARTGDLTVIAEYNQAVLSQNLGSNNRQLIQLSDWGYFYDAIKDANDVLEIVETASPGLLSAYQRRLFKGEALALKSMAYFYVARIWGDVPSAEKNNFGLRLSNQDAVGMAAAWAAEARGLLPWMLLNESGIESTALTAVRFNRTAITSLLVQEELWLKKDVDALSTLRNTFTELTQDSLSNFGLSTGTDRRFEIPENPLAATVLYMPLSKLNEIYPQGDTRRTALFTISTTQNRATLIAREQNILQLLPVTEIPLLFAEAAWRAGNLEEAKTKLIAAAAGAREDYSTLNEATFGNALLKERQRLLPGTGQRMFDLIRFAEVSTHIPAFTASDVQNGAAYWPLSASSMKGISWSQNNYWLSKNKL
ncbi:RagB/SusD family nutrient uptake outer membrane protein [Pedobacter sp. AW31-3R]|uniref:RagB/SusD family nutrient uptake outer membrane protein n=1 Tax=Pedobacter sp. AW31-3R TaxID=3445781 RepID=UPI003F9F9ECB